MAKNKTDDSETKPKKSKKVVPDSIEDEINREATMASGAGLRRSTGYEIIGWLIPDLTDAQAKEETNLHPSPVFSSEKGMYKKSLIFPTIDDAKAKIKERYGRDQ